MSKKDQIKFNSLPENLSLVEDFIEEMCNKYKVGPDVYGNILVSLTEAVNNAIYHGNKSQEDKLVTVNAFLNKDVNSISFVVIDEGVGFDYDNLPDPTAPENVTNIGGRGVFLIKQLADWVIFNDSGNQIELQFKL